MDEWNCGTAQCIAGWACSLSKLKWRPAESLKHVFCLQKGGYVGDVAARLLDLSVVVGADELTSESERLFFVKEWPPAFRRRFERARLRRRKAQIAAERIDHFIATNGAE